MKALVTGGAGFIGLHLARTLLSRGWQVDIIDNLSRTGSDPALAAVLEMQGSRLVAVDLRERQATAPLGDDYEVIVHLAALLGVANVIQNAFDTLSLNIALTEEIIRFARRQKRLSRLLFASTSEVYAHTVGRGTGPVPTPESVPLHLAALTERRQSYLLSKIAGEALCHYGEIPFTILRPHNVFGPRMGVAHVVPQIFQRIYSAADGAELEVYSADHTRTFCYIDDAVELMYRIIGDDRCRGQTLNIGSQTPEITIKALAGMMAKIAGKRLRLVPSTPHAGSPPRRCPDMTETNRLTGYTQRLELVDGLTRTYQWYRTHVFDRKKTPEVSAVVP